MDVYGIIGYPIKHSLSPAMHNAAFKELKIDAEYKKFEIKPEELEDFLINKKDILGFNITVPHKVKTKEIIEKQKNIFQPQPHYVDLCGAVNTVKRENDKLCYANTDVLGFLTSLKEDLKFDYKNKDVFLIGCGGAGRAIIAGLGYGDVGAREIYVYDISPDAVKSTKSFFSKFSYLENKLKYISKEEIPNIIKNIQLLINASSLGMREEEASIIDRELLHKDLSVYDVVYNRETQLVKDAKSLKLNAVGGLGMLLYQGTHAFELWTGKKAPIEIMRKVLKESLA